MMGSEPRPILLTGIPRSGTTWVGRTPCASGELGYLNEPFNLATSPGTIRVPADRRFPYVTSENEHDVLPELTKALAFRYPLGRELLRCCSRRDLLHTLKMAELRSEPRPSFPRQGTARHLLGGLVRAAAG
jgi:hypothetical protein